jgi:hypothetical protein
LGHFCTGRFSERGGFVIFSSHFRSSWIDPSLPDNLGAYSWSTRHRVTDRLITLIELLVVADLFMETRSGMRDSS